MVKRPTNELWTSAMHAVAKKKFGFISYLCNSNLWSKLLNFSNTNIDEHDTKKTPTIKDAKLNKINKWCDRLFAFFTNGDFLKLLLFLAVTICMSCQCHSPGWCCKASTSTVVVKFQYHPITRLDNKRYAHRTTKQISNFSSRFRHISSTPNSDQVMAHSWTPQASRDFSNRSQVFVPVPPGLCLVLGSTLGFASDS